MSKSTGVLQWIMDIIESKMAWEEYTDSPVFIIKTVRFIEWISRYLYCGGTSGFN